MQLIAAVGTGFLAHLFQSSSGQKAGCNRRGRSRQKQLFVVSILIRPSGRMQHEIVALDGQDLDVSILIRPEGRMQLHRMAAGTAWLWKFQSSSGAQGTGFRLLPVSILIRPEGRMQPASNGGGYGMAVEVSILIRPEGRMQRKRGAATVRSPNCFNPHPARRPDATSYRMQPRDPWSIAAFREWFQSSSGQKAGCNLPGATLTGLYIVEVSILIRPEGRMQPQILLPHLTSLLQFQSSSGLLAGQKAGCNSATRPET